MGHKDSEMEHQLKIELTSDVGVRELTSYVGAVIVVWIVLSETSSNPTPVYLFQFPLKFLGKVWIRLFTLQAIGK